MLRQKKIAEVKGAAEKYAACKDGENSDSDCRTQAKELFLSISGALDADYSDKLKTKIEKLGKRIFEGDTTTLVQKDSVSVAIETDGTTCIDKVKENFRGEVVANVGDGAKSNDATKKLQDTEKDVDCRIVDDKSEYEVSIDAKGMTTEDIDSASQALATKLNSVSYATSRRVRRLLSQQTTTSSYADQETVICSDTDTECTGEKIEEGDASSTTLGASVTALSSLASFIVACLFL